ncbi:glycosyltransferase [Gammaproteobacteria bacterium]|nr:glycosyltransferase [Gammaproteobacteria bacterium]
MEDAHLRILFWIDHLGRGGTQKVLCDLIEKFSELNYAQTVICLNDETDPSLMARLQCAGARVVIVGKTRLLSGWGLIGLFREVRANRFHTAITFLLFADIIGLTISHLAGIPNRISSQRSNNSHYGKVTSIVVRLCLKFASTIVLNSAIYRREVEKRFLPKCASIQIIPNGIRSECETFKVVQERDKLAEEKKRNNFRRQMQLDIDAYVIGSAGRLAPEKRFDIQVDALLEQGLEDVVLIIAGDGPERSSLRKRIAELGLDDRVRLLGFLGDMRQFYQGVDLYVQTSDFEGMPNAVLEAMSQGCAVLISNAGGSRELISDGSHGWMFEPGDLNQFVAQIRHIRSHPELSASKARSGQQYVSSKYDLDEIVRHWIRIVDCRRPLDQRPSV